MIASRAKEIARKFVHDELSGTPGFRGAFFHGSAVSLADDDHLPPYSDLDIIVVTDNLNPTHRGGKTLVQEVLLDVSYLPSSEVQSPERILSQSHLAGSFRAPGIIADPSGRLSKLQASVATAFSKREWVVLRCRHARDKVLHGYHLDPSAPFHDQVISWIFPAGITTHVLLVAGLRNPTVRKRYVAVRALLADYGLSGTYDDLLDLVGCTRMSRHQAVAHLEALTGAFDTASTIVDKPFPFASDISPPGRPIAIDGTRELIATGFHREAVFWLVVTWSRCQAVLYHDAPTGRHHRFDHGYRGLLDNLGIASTDDLRRRIDLVTESLPHVWDLAETIMAANQQIRD